MGQSKKAQVTTTIITAALGYFVDIYDLILFSVVRQKSLLGIGIEPHELLDKGIYLINMQMTGMLVGGIIWGILGDKKGRVSVLFGSIFMYSVANILNAYVTNISAYAVLRFIAGIGLAGELGAAITLVSEVMSKNKRGYGTTIVASVGICGAIVAAIVADYFTWQTAYIVGGVMGLALLIMRLGIYESGMFAELKSSAVSRGNPFLLLKSRKVFVRYLCCILIGVPIWYVIGILVSFSPEFAAAIGVQGVSAGTSVMYCYIGLALGDVGSGIISQLLSNRRKVVFLFLMLTLVTCLTYLFWGKFVASPNLNHIYYLCGALGFAVGYWAVFVTIASEQFGTNIRATVTTTVPNFVRGSVVPVSFAFQALKQNNSILTSGLIVGVSVIFVAAVAVFGLKESFGRDLDFVE